MATGATHQCKAGGSAMINKSQSGWIDDANSGFCPLAVPGQKAVTADELSGCDVYGIGKPDPMLGANRCRRASDIFVNSDNSAHNRRADKLPVISFEFHIAATHWLNQNLGEGYPTGHDVQVATQKRLHKVRLQTGKQLRCFERIYEGVSVDVNRLTLQSAPYHSLLKLSM